MTSPSWSFLSYTSKRLKAWGDYHQTTSASRRVARSNDYDLGFVDMDIKHLPKRQTANRESRKRYLYVAMTAARVGYIWQSMVTN